MTSDKSRLLIIDDDTKFCRLISSYLAGFGYDVQSVHDGAEGVVKATEEPWHAIILDVMLPSINGFEVLRRLRKESEAPVLMLTALGDEADRIVGLELGADDYLPKTSSPRELLARLRALIRRSSIRSDVAARAGDSGTTFSPGSNYSTSGNYSAGGNYSTGGNYSAGAYSGSAYSGSAYSGSAYSGSAYSAGGNQTTGSSSSPGANPSEEIVIGTLTIIIPARTAFLGDEMLQLTPVEFDLLVVLAQSKGRVKSRAELINEIRDRNYDVFDRSIDVHISALRRKLGDDPKHPKFIRTIRGAGYMLAFDFERVKQN
jgi:Response regulators consisting of a CheY-like receiver domain and a winged-helix DNA-binding domain